MATESINTVQSPRSIKDAPQRVPNNDIGKNEFLQLLVAQMANQDPLSPASDNEFIAQMAQFSTLEQMQNLNQSYDIQKAQTLMGEYVVGEIPAAQSTNGRPVPVAGLVEAMAIEKGGVYLKIGGNKLPVSGVTGVMDTTQYSKATADMLKGAELIGKQVVAKVLDQSGETKTLTGIVDKVIIKDGWLYALIGDKQVSLDTITEISTQVPVQPEPAPETEQPEPEQEVESPEQPVEQP